MVNNNMRSYDYFTIGGVDAYGQPQLSAKQGYIKMAIYLNNQSVQDNIKFKEAAYIGVTYNKQVNDSYVIQYGNEKLKVLYVVPTGRYSIVHMGEYLD